MVTVGLGSVNHESFLSTSYPSLALLRETVISSLRLVSDKDNKHKRIVLGGELPTYDEHNKVISQRQTKASYKLIVFTEKDGLYRNASNGNCTIYSGRSFRIWKFWHQTELACWRDVHGSVKLALGSLSSTF